MSHSALNPSDFVTEFDAYPRNAKYAEEQYQKGLDHGIKGWLISIDVDGRWSASRDGVHITSYERIGYHACTADLVRGWVDGGAAIHDYREPTQ